MANFLTNYNLPDQNIWKEVFTNQWETTNILIEDCWSFTIQVRTYDINFVSITLYSFGAGPISNDRLYTLGIGPANLVAFGVNLTNVSYYEVSIVTACGDTSTIKRKMITNCSVYPNVRVMFLNRLGGFDYYNFNYDSKYSVNVQRQEFNRTLPWNYNVGDRGRSVLTIDADEQYIANTDWVTEYDYNFLQELVTSPNVYIIDESTMVKLPIIILDATWDQKTQLREKIFNMTLTYKMAYNLQLQSY
jgi:hypothetical protein